MAAAAQTFAELGYAATTMAAVAERAGSSVGNLYKYFAGKQELFEAAVPAELVRELLRRTRARIRALGAKRDVRELGPHDEYHALAGELLDYCLAHRAAVVVVLSRAEGTAFASFAPDFVEKLVEWALDYARAPYPELRVTAELRFALRHAYTSFVRGVAEALRTFAGDGSARHAIALLTAQHQGGLKRLFETQTATEGAGHVEVDSRNAAEPSVVPQPAGARARNARAFSADSSVAGSPAGQAHRARRTRRRS